MIRGRRITPTDVKAVQELLIEKPGLGRWVWLWSCRHYGAPVWWAESFVDRQRFEAISYRAAHWQGIGWTRGFAKRPEGFVRHGHKKEVYVYVIEPRMRRWIYRDDRQPLLTREFLLAQRRLDLFLQSLGTVQLQLSAPSFQCRFRIHDSSHFP